MEINLSIHPSTTHTHSLQTTKRINGSPFATTPNIPTLQALQKSWEILTIHDSASLIPEPEEAVMSWVQMKKTYPLKS